jgi:hypothetical protein
LTSEKKTKTVPPLQMLISSTADFRSNYATATFEGTLVSPCLMSSGSRSNYATTTQRRLSEKGSCALLVEAAKIKIITSQLENLISLKLKNK